MLNLVPCASSFQVGSAIGEAKAPPKPMTTPKHEDVNCHLLWREKPLGTGESSVIIIPCDKKAEQAIHDHQTELRKIFDSSTDSEETIDFTIQELDQ